MSKMEAVKVKGNANDLKVKQLKLDGSSKDEAPLLDNSIVKDDSKFKMVGIAIDLTGKTLSDEICQIGAYTVSENSPKVFAQYIMPYRSVSAYATRLHGVRDFRTYGPFRVLKDVRSMRTVRTKSEYSTLNEFIEWLKTVKGNSDGVILVHHGNVISNLMPFLVEALDRYKLTNDFFDIVRGCINCKTISAGLPEMKDRALALRSLLCLVLDYEEDKIKAGIFESARSRARLTYNIVAKILKNNDTLNALDFITSKEQELENLAKKREHSIKIKSLRPIFRKRELKEPRRAVTLRMHLIDHGIDYETLKTAYDTESKDGIAKIVEKTSAKKKDIEDLTDIIVAHFKKSGESGKPDVNANIIKNGVNKKGRGGSADHSKRERDTSDSDDGGDSEDEEEFEEAQTGENQDKS